MKTEDADHVVLISGGIASFVAAKRVIDKFGKKNVKLWFFDTLIEDDDLYRFLVDIEKLFGIQITWFTDGRNPWDVFRDERFIGNSRADVCSKHLKRLYLERELRISYADKQDAILYFGLDWSEKHRVDVLKRNWENKGYTVEFPLLWEPWKTTNEYREIIESFGISVPRLYDLGFPHNNCGGACIKAGIYQWANLWKIFPDRYKWHEENEQKIRKMLNKNISILRNRKRGITRPMTLRNLRLRLEKTNGNNGLLINDSDIVDDSTCSCFVNFEELKSNS